MVPSDLKADSFANYPPKARRLALAHLELLRQLPPSFIPNLLNELIDYDFRFPSECSVIDRELNTLSSLSHEQLQERFQAFSKLSVSPKLLDLDWVNQPGQFVEEFSAYLWTTHQQDAFREAAIAYGDRLKQEMPTEPDRPRRLGVAVIGQGVVAYDAPLFRNLRRHGTYFKQVNPKNGFQLLLNGMASRAKANPIPYGHWYIDGGQASDHSSLLSCVSFQGLEPVRTALLKNIQKEIARPGMGPEELRTHMARLTPADLGMDASGDEVLSRFQIKLFTEGSGTQIFSTTFAQWTAREALRRAQPSTMLVRFAPRQRQRPMNELLSADDVKHDFDFIGSLVDADMGAYYQWINQQRLPDSEHSSFLVWFEEHEQAVVIAPTLPRGTESNSTFDLGELLSLAVG